MSPFDRAEREDMAMLKRIEIENQKSRDKEQKKLMEEKKRAKELKDNLQKQLAAKAEHKRFEAEEERQLQIAANKRAAMEEAKRKANLEELMEKMKSKQKIGDSIAADVNAIARADEERALREQIAYDEKKRQKEVLESLEYQLKLKQEKAQQNKKDRQQQAVLLAADAEKAHMEAMAQMDAQHKKKQDYYDVLTEHIDMKQRMKQDNVGMSGVERQLNK